jgi:hypothetical protein
MVSLRNDVALLADDRVGVAGSRRRQQLAVTARVRALVPRAGPEPLSSRDGDGQALDELGRVARTIFLCEYLADEAVRHEVHEGRQVIEHWNSGIDFISTARCGSSRE